MSDFVFISGKGGGGLNGVASGGALMALCRPRGRCYYLFGGRMVCCVVNAGRRASLKNCSIAVTF